MDVRDLAKGFTRTLVDALKRDAREFEVKVDVGYVINCRPVFDLPSPVIKVDVESSMVDGECMVSIYIDGCEAYAWNTAEPMLMNIRMSEIIKKIRDVRNMGHLAKPVRADLIHYPDYYPRLVADYLRANLTVDTFGGTTQYLSGTRAGTYHEYRIIGGRKLISVIMVMTTDDSGNEVLSTAVSSPERTTRLPNFIVGKIHSNKEEWVALLQSVAETTLAEYTA